ncbi:hypothetical protein ACP8Y2_06440 [Herpetosiphon llansteffanensis]
MAEIIKLEQFCQAVGDGLRLVQGQRGCSMVDTEHYVADYLGIGVETLRSLRYRSRNRATVDDKTLAMLVWIVLAEGRASLHWLKTMLTATSLILPEPLNSSWLERYVQSPFKQPLTHCCSSMLCRA